MESPVQYHPQATVAGERAGPAMNTPERSIHQPRKEQTPPLHISLAPLQMSSENHLEMPYPSEPRSPSPMARPPTPGGGPLSSHPATPVNATDRFTPPPSTPTEQHQPLKKADSVTESQHQLTPPRQAYVRRTPPRQTPSKSIPVTDAASAYSLSRPTSSHLNANRPPNQTGVPLRKPLAEASPNAQKPRRRNSTGVRKLLSLSSLRSSFSSSRTSLALSRSPTVDNLTSPSSSSNKRRPSSPSLSQTLSPETASTFQTYSASVSGGLSSSAHANEPESPTAARLRKRKSGSWFRRASMIWSLDGEDGGLENVPESREGNYATKTGYDTSASMRDRTPRSPMAAAPTLPELKGMNAEKEGRWGEGMFASIGRS